MQRIDSLTGRVKIGIQQQRPAKNYQNKTTRAGIESSNVDLYLYLCLKYLLYFATLAEDCAGSSGQMPSCAATRLTLHATPPTTTTCPQRWRSHHHHPNILVLNLLDVKMDGDKLENQTRQAWLKERTNMEDQQT